jgi:hypothetical protein
MFPGSPHYTRLPACVPHTWRAIHALPSLHRSRTARRTAFQHTHGPGLQPGLEGAHLGIIPQRSLGTLYQVKALLQVPVRSFQRCVFRGECRGDSLSQSWARQLHHILQNLQRLWLVVAPPGTHVSQRHIARLLFFFLPVMALQAGIVAELVFAVH